MKQAILYGAGDLRIEDRALDPRDLTDNQVYVKTLTTALSTGTDLGNYLGRSRDIPGAPDYPRAIGYCNVGVVSRVGSQVAGLKIGERVFSLKPHQSEYIAEQTELMVAVPESVPSDEGSLAYLAQLGLVALRQARYEAGENIAIVGLGVIGLCTCGLARALGAKVVGIANSPARAEVARQVGAHAAFLAGQLPADGLRGAFGQEGADIVVLTANTWDAYRLAVEIARHRGRIAILGFPGRAQPQPAFNPLDPEWFYGKQLELIGAGRAPFLDCAPDEVRFNARRNLEYLIAVMASGDLALKQVISHRFPWNRMQEAYELAQQHSKSLTAAVFDWTGAS
jgi:threonine dehydrogenase-like Zn-dependent dehydrogenase